MDETSMTASLNHSDDDSGPDSRYDKIVMYSKGATLARKQGDKEQAREYFEKSLTEIRSYISDLETQEKSLQEGSEEQQWILEVKSELEDLKTNIRKELKLL